MQVERARESLLDVYKRQQHLTQAEINTRVDYTGRFARELHVNGLVNVQYAVSNGKVYVIEVNPRSSRTVPYIAKVTGVPMVDLAVRCCLCLLYTSGWRRKTFCTSSTASSGQSMVATSAN